MAWYREHYQVPQAQLILETPEDHQAHEIRRILPPIEGRPGPLVEFPLTVAAAEALVAEFGAIGTFGGGG
jgi:hypothetical protein